MEPHQVDAAAVAPINALAARINSWAIGKGFWTIPDPVIIAMRNSQQAHAFITRAMKAQKLALVTTETSEQVEAVRKPDAPTGIEGFSNEEEELADQIIRLLDYGAQYGLRIGEAIVAKMAVNEGRPYKHGKEF